VRLVEILGEVGNGSLTITACGVRNAWVEVIEPYTELFTAAEIV
jgi:hypothetical protein